MHNYNNLIKSWYILHNYTYKYLKLHIKQYGVMT